MDGLARRKAAARLALLAMGFTATGAQVLVVRELLVAFHGNELFLGVIFGNWLLLEAAGSLWARRRADRSERAPERFALLQIAIGFVCVLSLLWIRSFKWLRSISSGELLGVGDVVVVSLAALGPLSLAAGALFPFGCRSLSLVEPRSESAARAYVYEAAGAFAAGLAFVLYLIQRLNTIELAGLLLALNLGTAVLLLWALNRAAALRLTALALLGLVGLAFAWAGPRRLHELSARRLWHDQALVETRNSVYANLAVVAAAGQYSFFANGAPYATTPSPAAMLEELAHLPMLFHHQPEQILVIGGGAGGLLAELVKHPSVRRIDYAEPDPLVLELFRKFPTPLTSRELDHPAVRVRLVEGRQFLRTAAARYDLILVNLPVPATLQLNRYYTAEFFRLARRRLNPRGLLAVSLPGSETVLGPELLSLNRTFHATLRSGFAYVRVVAGDQNLFLASPDAILAGVGPDTLARRWRERGITAGLIHEAYLHYRFGLRRLEELEQSITASAYHAPNRDLHPRGLLDGMRYLHSVISPATAGFLAAIDLVRFAHWLAGITLLAAVLYAVQRRYRPRLFLGGAIVSTGFAGMLLSILLIFLLQIHYGHIYHYIGILTALFMLGSAGGAYAALRCPALSLRAVESAIVLLVALLYLFSGLGGALPGTQFFIGGMMLAAGLLTGAEFPLAVRRADASARAVSATAGRFYALDLCGALFGAVLAAGMLVPTVGVPGALLVALVLKAGSLLLVCCARA